MCVLSVDSCVLMVDCCMLSDVLVVVMLCVLMMVRKIWMSWRLRLVVFENMLEVVVCVCMVGMV